LLLLTPGMPSSEELPCEGGTLDFGLVNLLFCTDCSSE
jgi:hypothetical protein